MYSLLLNPAFVLSYNKLIHSKQVQNVTYYVKQKITLIRVIKYGNDSSGQKKV